MTVNRKKVILFIFLLLFFLVIGIIIHPIYESNDDREMITILSGVFGSKYAPNAVFIGFPLSWLISILYRACSSVPWYGLFFSGILMVSSFFILSDVLFEKQIKLEKKTRIIISISILIGIYFNSFIVQQFTVISAILAGTAIYLMCRDKHRIAVIIMMILSYEIRNDVFLMSLPFIIIAIFAKNISIQRIRDIIKKTIPIILCVFIIVCGGKIVNEYAYSSNEWKEYSSFNNLRSEIYDRTDFENNNDYKKTCLENGFTETDFYAASTYRLLYDDSIDIDKLNTINRIVNDKHKDSIPVKIAKVMYYDIKNIAVTYWIYTIISIMLLIMILLLFRKNRRILFICGAAIGSKYLIISYLVWFARLPERVFFGLTLVYILLLAGVSLQKFESNKYNNNRIIKIIPYILLVAVIILSISKVSFHSYISKYNYDYYGINKYCKTHKNNKYILATDLIGTSSSYVFDSTKSEFIFMEPWFPKYPGIKQILEKDDCVDFSEELVRNNYLLIAHKSFGVDKYKKYLEKRFKKNIVLKESPVLDDYYLYSFKTN